MNPDTDNSVSSQAMVLLAAFVVIVAGMKASALVLVPFLLSAFIAIVLSPPMFWLQRRGAPAWLSLGIVIITLIAGIVLLTGLLRSSVQRFTQDLPMYQAKLGQTLTAVQQWLEDIGFAGANLGLSDLLDPGAVMGIVSAGLNGLVTVLKNGFLIVMTVSFMLAEAFNLPAKLRAATGGDKALSTYRAFLTTMNRYLAIKAATSLLTGLAVAAFLWIIGVEYVVLWALLAFFLNFVPTIGSFIAAIPPILLAVVQMGWGHAALVAGGYLIINVIISNLIEPRFMGRGLGLSVLVVFLSLIFWGWVLGPVGMLLSIPLTIMVKIALESSPRTRATAIFLGPQSHLEGQGMQMATQSPQEPEPTA